MYLNYLMISSNNILFYIPVLWRFFYQGVQDASFYRSQLLRIQNFIKDPAFPQSREICENTDRKLPYILQIKWDLYMY